MIDFLRDRLIALGTIDPIDAECMLVTDSPEEAATAITDVAMRRFGLTYGPQARRRWYLWE